MRVLFWLSVGMDRRTPSEHLLTDMVAALCKQGHAVHILQKNTDGPKSAIPEELVRLGVETTAVPYRTPKKSDLPRRFLSDVRYALRCRKWLKAHGDFDRIFLQSSNVAGIQSRILKQTQKGVPTVFNVQDIFPENAVYSGRIGGDGIVYRVFSKMQRYAYRYASRIITISEDMQDQLLELGVEKEKLGVIYNWSYTDKAYSPEEMDFGCLDGIIDRSKFNVIYAGNIGMMQNVELVIRAGAIMSGERDVCFHIIGDGMYREKLEKLASELGADNVRFHDMLGADCAPAIYCAADVNIVPLAENIYRTALPSKTATCLASGRPVIFAMGRGSRFAKKLADVPGIYVVEEQDAEALAGEIMQIRSSGPKVCTAGIFEACFSRTENSVKYADAITSVI